MAVEAVPIARQLHGLGIVQTARLAILWAVTERESVLLMSCAMSLIELGVKAGAQGPRCVARANRRRPAESARLTARRQFAPTRHDTEHDEPSGRRAEGARRAEAHWPPARLCYQAVRWPNSKVPDLRRRRAR